MASRYFIKKVAGSIKCIKGVTLIEILTAFSVYIILILLAEKVYFKSQMLLEEGKQNIKRIENYNIIEDELKKSFEEANFLNNTIRYENNSSTSIYTTDSNGILTRASVKNLYKPLIYLENYNETKPYFLIVKEINGEKLLYKYYSDATANIIISGFDDIILEKKDDLIKVCVTIDKNVFVFYTNIQLRKIVAGG